MLTDIVVYTLWKCTKERGESRELFLVCRLEEGKRKDGDMLMCLYQILLPFFFIFFLPSSLFASSSLLLPDDFLQTGRTFHLG